MPLFGNQDVTHPTQERRLPGSPDWGRSRKRRRLQNPLPKPLMGSGLIERDNIHVEKLGELLLMEKQEMIQAFAPHTAQKAFAGL